MDSVIQALASTTTGISNVFLWDQVGPIVPLILIIFGFAFGIYMIVKTIRDLLPGIATY